MKFDLQEQSNLECTVLHCSYGCANGCVVATQLPLSSTHSSVLFTILMYACDAMFFYQTVSQDSASFVEYGVISGQLCRFPT